MLLKYLTFANISIAAFVCYISFVVKQFHSLLNPLHGLEITGPTVDPLWAPGEEFVVICFLSTSQTFKNVNISKLRADNRLLYESDKMKFNVSSEVDVSVRVDLMRYNRNNSIDDEDLPNALPALPASSSSSSSSSSSAISYINYTMPVALWDVIHANASNVYLHALLMKNGQKAFVSASDIKSGDALHGSVQLIKYETIPKSFKHRYLLSDFGLVSMSTRDMERINMSAETVISYWKPEAAIKIVSDFSKYPYSYLPNFVRNNIVRSPSASTSTSSAVYYKPPVVVDEIGLTSDQYIPLNQTVDRISLKLSFGLMSSQRWVLLSHISSALESQKDIGFTDKDIDDVRHMISNTSISLLAVTMLASMLHLLFEFLAYHSDVTFWKENESLAGLSSRALLTDLISQVIVLLYLIESEASLIITVPSACGICVQLWKVQKATGFSLKSLRFERWKPSDDPSTGPLTSTVIVATADEDVMVSPSPQPPKTNKEAKCPATSYNDNGDSDSGKSKDERFICRNSSDQLVEITIEADRFATSYLFSLLLPVVILFSLRSLVYEMHRSWYSWFIGSLTGCVYTFGFVLMCPQLYINHKLKSVAHLPWKVLVFKFVNTFIDDLFAFIIRMPTMHRLSVFRDDLVFFIYLYQRYKYRIDDSRPVER